MVSSNKDLSRDLSNSTSVGRSLSDDRPSISGERANDSGGWREHESRNGYKSTSDRLDSHFSNYGKDSAYTNSYNNTFGKRDWAGVSSRYSKRSDKPAGLSGAKSGLVGGQVENGLLVNAELDINNPDKYLESTTGAQRVGEYIDSGLVSKMNPKDWNVNLGKGVNAEYDNLNNRFLGNTVGGIAAPTVAGVAAGAIGKGVGSMISGSVAGKLASNTGDIVVGIKNATNQSGFSEFEKQAQQIGSDIVGESYKNGKSGWATGLGAVADLVTGTPLGSAAASGFNHESGLSNVAKELSGLGDIDQKVETRKAGIKEAQRIDAERRALDGSNTQFQSGILGNISKSRQATSRSQSNHFYTIPGISNLWDNLIINKGH